MSTIAKSASSSAAANPEAVPDRAGVAPAASTACTSLSDQIRSWARIAIRCAMTSVDGLREVVEDVARRDDAGRASVLDDRDMAEPADGHLVDRDRDRVVVSEDDRVGRHEVTHMERGEPLAGRLHHRIT